MGVRAVRRLAMLRLAVLAQAVLAQAVLIQAVAEATLERVAVAPEVRVEMQASRCLERPSFYPPSWSRTGPCHSLGRIPHRPV